MKVYRIAKQRFIHDLSGEGARRFGGRWNRKGVGVLYTSESRSLATVEYLVHLAMGILPPDLALAVLEIPDAEPLDRLDPSTLGPGWNSFPSPIELSDRGSSWAQRGQSLGLWVPSSVVNAEWNLLLNPEHRNFSEVKLLSVEPYALDPRLAILRQ